MVNIPLYKTYLDYPNESGLNQIMYPLRDSIAIINPFFVILFGIFTVLTVSSYYAFATFTGRTRFFNSLLASSFSTTVVSFFFSLAGWVTPYHVLTFIGITVISFILTIFYRQ
jgi:ABC-type multidrug transport system permease subunit